MSILDNTHKTLNAAERSRSKGEERKIEIDQARFETSSVEELDKEEEQIEEEHIEEDEGLKFKNNLMTREIGGDEVEMKDKKIKRSVDQNKEKVTTVRDLKKVNELTGSDLLAASMVIVVEEDKQKMKRIEGSDGGDSAVDGGGPMEEDVQIVAEKVGKKTAELTIVDEDAVTGDDLIVEPLVGKVMKDAVKLGMAGVQNEAAKDRFSDEETSIIPFIPNESIVASTYM